MQRCAPRVVVDPRDLTAQASIFKALGDPARATILATLARAGGEVCVCDLTSGLALNQSTVSHHLKILKDARLVTSERRGTWGYYALAAGARERLGDAIDTVFGARAARKKSPTLALA